MVKKRTFWTSTFFFVDSWVGFLASSWDSLKSKKGSFSGSSIFSDFGFLIGWEGVTGAGLEPGGLPSTLPGFELPLEVAETVDAKFTAERGLSLLTRIDFVTFSNWAEWKIFMHEFNYYFFIFFR